MSAYFVFDTFNTSYESFDFRIWLFAPLMMIQTGDESNLEKYGTFLNSFLPKFKQLIQRLERIKERIGWHKVSVLFN